MDDAENKVEETAAPQEEATRPEGENDLLPSTAELESPEDSEEEDDADEPEDAPEGGVAEPALA